MTWEYRVTTTSVPDYGPLESFEVVWKSGHVETINAHQVIHENEHMLFYGQINGLWQLLLAARRADIVSIRNVSHTEDRLDGAS